MKKVIITGATGLIGKNAIQPLIDSGFEIYATTRETIEPTLNVNWVKCNIFDKNAIEKIFNKIKPKYLLNFAWATTEDYLSSDINYEFLNSGLNLLECFYKNGGKRAVYAGTCFEYDFKNEPLKENDKTNPTTIYAKCKNELREKAEVFCHKNNISFGWGRIFYVFGAGENEKRLTPFVINSLKNNKEVKIKSSQLIKDYMYTKEIARAFTEFLSSDVTGIVNICSAQGISLGGYCSKIAQKLNKEDLLTLEENKSSEPMFIIGYNKRLTEEVKFNALYSIEEALDELLERGN